MNDKERAAMQQALEAMEAAGAVPNWFTDYRHKAITALREALAEPVAIEQGPIGMIIGGRLECLADEYETGAWPIYTAPQPVIQEPVCEFRRKTDAVISAEKEL